MNCQRNLEQAVGPSKRPNVASRKPIAIMDRNRENARVVLEPGFAQDIERPKVLRRDRKARRPVSDDGFASYALQNSLRSQQILSKCLGRHFVDKLMAVTMRRDFMPVPIDFPHEFRAAL